MYKTTIILLCVLCLIHQGSTRANRIKRRLLFTKNSKLFFRLNGKDNVIPWTTLFAHGWAFRINWDLPETYQKRIRFFKRDVHNDIMSNIHEAGVPQYTCILNYACNIMKSIKTSEKCGVLCEIGNIISRSQGVDADFFTSIFEKCDYYSEICSNSTR